MSIKPIEPVEVVRDAEGWFSHPQYFTEPEWDIDSMTSEDFYNYLKDRDIDYAITDMEGDDFDMHTRYCEEGQCDCSAWEPSRPAGDGWFVLSIHDTEDGPVCVWGRRRQEQQP